MTDDVRASQARAAHAEAMRLEGAAGDARAKRDTLVRALRRDDPRAWSYAKLARAVGCSPELVAYIVRTGR